MASRKRKAADFLIDQCRSTKPLPEDKKLSVEFCRKLLCAGGKVYTDEEVIKIREYLYRLAEIDYLITISIDTRVKENPP